MAKDKPKHPPKDKTSVAEENLARIREMQHSVRQCERDAEEAKGEHKLAKQTLENERAKLAKLIEVTEAGSKDPLFKEVGHGEPSKNGKDLEDDESWKDVLLSEVFCSLTKGLQQKVSDANLISMADITEFCKNQQLTDIPGVGQANADKLQAAMDEFWKRRKEQAAAPPVEEPAVAEELPEAAEKEHMEGVIPMAKAEPLEA